MRIITVKLIFRAFKYKLPIQTPFKFLESSIIVCGILLYYENNNNNNAAYGLIDVWTTMNHSISFMVYAKSYHLPSACSDPFNVRVFTQAYNGMAAVTQTHLYYSYQNYALMMSVALSIFWNIRDTFFWLIRMDEKNTNSLVMRL